MSIRSFRHKGLKRLYEKGETSDINPALAGKLADLLLALETSVNVEDMGRFPGWRLHPLKGKLKGFWSVTVSGNWRLIFRFEDGDALDLDLTDCH
jgi:proteic killer suppression protein